MSAIIQAFGIDWRLLIIDTINFGLVLFTLWYFLYTPLLGMLEKRREKVAQGVHDANAAEQKLHEIEEARAGMLGQAGKEADDILARARKTASDKERELVLQGEAAAARILSEAQLQAAEAKAQAILESREEVAKLIVLGMEKTMAHR